MSRRRRPRADDAEIRARVLQEVAARVQERGWTFIFTPFEGHPIAFGYSVGFTATFGYPEAMVLGLGHETTAFVLSRLAEKLAAGERPEPGGFIELGLNFPVVLRTVPAETARGRMYVANAFYEGRPDGYEAVQVVWPDARGRFPWEAGHERTGSYQPLLFQGPPTD